MYVGSQLGYVQWLVAPSAYCKHAFYANTLKFECDCISVHVAFTIYLLLTCSLTVCTQLTCMKHFRVSSALSPLPSV